MIAGKPAGNAQDQQHNARDARAGRPERYAAVFGPNNNASTSDGQMISSNPVAASKIAVRMSKALVIDRASIHG